MADSRRGLLRIYLGAAPGVGKTVAMLEEGRRRASRGTDVVIGFVEHHARPRTLEATAGLEVVPRQVLLHRGHPFEEMDLDAILARHPVVALVDELAHTNVGGGHNPKRWMDVEELLAAGIDVITTLNVQHLESLNDVVESITGIRQGETVPDHVARRADQVELVDMTPEALRRRMVHGNIYAADKVDEALGNYFRVGNLTALRELSLTWLAESVDEALTDYQDLHRIGTSWETRERVVVALTGGPTGEALIRRATRLAGRVGGELIGVHVRAGDGLTATDVEALERQRALLTDLGGTYHEVVGDDIGVALVQFARAERATQLVLGATQRSRWSEWWRGPVISRVARAAGDLDVHVISRATTAEPPSRPPRRSSLRSPLSGRRRRAGWLLAIGGLPLLTVALVAARDQFSLSGGLMAYVLLIVAVASVGGTGPGLVAAFASGLLVNWYLTEPYRTLTIAEPENTAALIAFVVVSTVVSLLVSRAERRAMEARRANDEAESLARVAAGLALAEDPMPQILDRIRGVFQLRSAALHALGPSGWRDEYVSGEPVAPDPAEATLQIPVTADGTSVLALTGPLPNAADRRILNAFANQMATALEQRRLRTEAADAQVAAQGDALRTALLRAVSHDLRSPLASIKASVSSLLQDDIEWSEQDRLDFHQTIDEETDRLDLLVGNLLDMGRLETGVLDLSTRPVGWEEVVAAASASIDIDAGSLTIAVPASLPMVEADPALLERALANVVVNALRHRGDRPVELIGTDEGAVVALSIVDHGMGVDPAMFDRLFEPFQRLGDKGGTGVGLGLAVAHGFVHAMGGTIAPASTPGGGLTMVVRLPSSERRG